MPLTQLGARVWSEQLRAGGRELSSEQMHDDEALIDGALVRRLIDSQFPIWTALPLTRVRPAGTDNALYRLGSDLVVRLPRTQDVTVQAAKEQLWLPRLAPMLPLPIPVPVAVGLPGEGYPWPWAVYRWLTGEPAAAGVLGHPHRTARVLGEFVVALQHVDPGDGPSPGEHNFYRGGPLGDRDRHVREAIRALSGSIETTAVTSAWEAALDAAVWEGPPAWIHGDLHAGNLLVDRGVVTAVLDFGGLAVADPACDLMVAWTFLPAGARAAFRATVLCDDASWVRGRGWALSMALIAIPYYLTRNPPFAAEARRWLDEVLADR